jgi:hypothetical protein
MRRTSLPVVLIAALWSGGCTPRPSPPLPPPPTPVSVLHEEEIKTIERPRLELHDVAEAPSADGATVTVTGTVVNRGPGTAHSIVIRVEALDANGGVVLRTTATPSQTVVTPSGTATFSAVLDDRPEIVRYRVEAVGR